MSTMPFWHCVSVSVSVAWQNIYGSKIIRLQHLFIIQNKRHTHTPSRPFVSLACQNGMTFLSCFAPISVELSILLFLSTLSAFVHFMGVNVSVLWVSLRVYYLFKSIFFQRTMSMYSCALTMCSFFTSLFCFIAFILTEAFHRVLKWWCDIFQSLATFVSSLKLFHLKFRGTRIIVLRKSAQRNRCIANSKDETNL